MAFRRIGQIHSQCRHQWQQVRSFWRNELWQLDPSTLPTRSALLLRGLRVLDLVGRGIRQNDLRVNASGLTYMTLMALVPMVAIAIWIFKALGFHTQFLEQAKSYLVELPPHFQTFFDGTLTMVEQTNFAQLGIVGATILVLTAFGLLGKMESAINKIWGITKLRSVLRRWTNYLGFIILVPILVFAAFSIAIPVNPFTSLQGKLGTFIAVWISFGFIYAKLPNTQVRMLASTSAGFVAAMLWLGWLWIFILVQPGVTRYNIIYGTLSFLPVFLAWLYISWMIVLLGGEIAFAIQREKSFQLHREGGRISLATQMAVALAIMLRASKAFKGDEPLFELNAFSHEHQIPYRFLQETLDRLTAGGLLVRSEGEDAQYVLAKSPTLISVQHIVDLFLNRGRNLVDLELASFHEQLKPLTRALGSQLEASLKPISLEELT